MLHLRSLLLVLIVAGQAGCRGPRTDVAPTSPSALRTARGAGETPAARPRAKPPSGPTPRRPPLAKGATAQARARAVFDGWVIYDRDADDVLCAMQREEEREVQVWVMLPSGYSYNSRSGSCLAYTSSRARQN